MHCDICHKDDKPGIVVKTPASKLHIMEFWVTRVCVKCAESRGFLTIKEADDIRKGAKKDEAPLDSEESYW